MRSLCAVHVLPCRVLFAEMWWRREMFGRSCSRLEFLETLTAGNCDDLAQLNIPLGAVKIIK